MGKQMFYSQLEMGLDAAYQQAAEVMACNMMCEDAAEGIDAFMVSASRCGPASKQGSRAGC